MAFIRRFFSSTPSATDLQALFSKHLQARIKLQGPLSVAAFMREVLTNPLAGYYMHRDVFGARGDFVTSPEISQLFGELMGIWCVATWQHLGSPKSFNIVELGPGRGTLIADVLRTIKKFPTCHQAFTGLHLVEVSPTMRHFQRAVLCPQTATSKIPTDPREIETDKTPTGLPVSWHRHYADTPSEPSIVIGHEFLDALPTHQFVYTEEGWAEVMVDLAEESSGKLFRWVRSKKPSLNTIIIKRVLPDLQPVVGQTYEISPDAFDLTTLLGDRISSVGGAALFVDYGQNTAEKNSLRAIRHHKFVDPLESVGEADLSVDVDFSAIKDTRVETYGPLIQTEFLGRLGIENRLETLLRSAKGDSKQQQDLIDGFERLVGQDQGQMGKVYKALTMVPKGSGPPPAFEFANTNK